MEETKKCPYCGGEILAVAKKCKHCGKWLNEEPTSQTTAEIPSENEQRPMEETSHRQEMPPSKNSAKLYAIVLATAGVICLIIGLLLCFMSFGERYYLLGGEIWQPTCDYSNFVALISDSEEDTFAGGKGWAGDIGIGTKGVGEKIRPIVTSSEIYNSSQFRGLTGFTSEEAFGFINQVEPSSKLANIVFFGFYPDGGYGSEEFDVYGRVNIVTKEFELLPGRFVGLIRDGKFKDCYLCKRNDAMYIFPQSDLYVTSQSLMGFWWQNYFERYPTDEELMELVNNL